MAGFAAGDEVFALTRFDHDGVAADYAAVPPELPAPRPLALSHAESAATPLPAREAFARSLEPGRRGKAVSAVAASIPSGP